MMWTIISVFILCFCCIFNLCIWSHCCKENRSKKHSEIYDEQMSGTFGTQGSRNNLSSVAHLDLSNNPILGSDNCKNGFEMIN